jgi:cytidyltransferase-like protein
MNIANLSIIRSPNSLEMPTRGESPSKVIYYQGTFDPVHKGHISTLETAMKATKASHAVVLADNSDNIYKGQRAPCDKRSEMASRAFSTLPNVFISTAPKKDLQQKLLERCEVINLIGSDVWPFYSKKADTPFRNICISMRDEDSPDELPNPTDKAVTFIRPPETGCSSTSIREYLRTHPEIYTRDPSLFSLPPPLDKLEPSVLSFIIENRLYYPLLESVKNEIKDFISSFFKPHETEVSCLTNTEDGGKSGDLTFKVESNGNKYFTKGYIRDSHKKNFRDEVEGIRHLNSLSLSWSSAPGPILWEETNDAYSHIGLPYVKDKDLSKVFKSLSIENVQHEDFISMCFNVGRALSELHSKVETPIDRDTLEKTTKKLKIRAEKCLSQSPSKLMHLKSSFDSASITFLNNPGKHTYTHGDANLSNFIVHLDTGKVTFLDLERFFALRTEEGSPLGFPAEDYHRFLSGLIWLNNKHPIANQTLHSAIKAFQSGYETYPSSITPEAHAYFSSYWLLRSAQSQLG